MNVVVPPAPSGLPAVDRQWGGLAIGRTYLLVGRAGVGRSALALQTVKAAVEDGTKCLLISPRAPEALVETARDIGLDPAQAHAGGLLRLLRIPPAADLAKRGADGLAKSYRDLVGLVEADRPGRVVIEDFTPLVQFDTFERFHEAFAELVGDLRDLDATLVVGLGDPANDASRRLLDVVGSLVDGTIQLSASGNILLKTPPVAEPETAPDQPAEPPTVELPTDETPLEPPTAPVLSTSDGASVETDAPRPPGPTTPEPIEPESAKEERPAADATPLPLVAVEHEATAPATSGPPLTDVVPPPAADPDLLLPSGDTFGFDPADAIMEQGFLADSSAGFSSASAAPQAGQALSFPLPPDQPFAPPPVSAPLPAFAPLGGAPSPSPADAFRARLDAAFQSCALGTPFLVVATRMDPTQPESAHFPTVEAGLRSALRQNDHILVDAERTRAVVLLPASGPEAGQTLFAELQAHLRAALGDQAEPVLAAIGAVTVPDGQPFASAQDLLAYAFEG